MTKITATKITATKITATQTTATKVTPKTVAKAQTSRSSADSHSSVNLKCKPFAKQFMYRGPVLAVSADGEDYVLIPEHNLSLTDAQLAHVQRLLVSGHLVPLSAEVAPTL